MSLINIMLNNLEERQAYLSEDQDTALQGLSSINDENFHDRDKGYLGYVLTGFLFTAVAAAGAYYIYVYSPAISDNHDPAPVLMDVVHDYDLPDTVSLSNDKQINAVPGATTVKGENQVALKMDYALTINGSPADTVMESQDEETSASISTSIPALTDFQVDHFDELGTVVKLMLTGINEYRIYKSGAPDSIHVEFDKRILLPGTLPVKIQSGIITGISGSYPDQDRTVLTFALVNEADVDLSELRESGEGYELTVYISTDPGDTMDTSVAAGTEQPTGTAEKDVVIKQPEGTMSLSKNSVTSDQLLSQSINDYRKGRLADALEQAYRALEIDPAHIQARSTLTNYLIEQHALRDALLVLDTGLKIHPQHYDWLTLKAKMLVNMGRNEEAINLLAASGPDIREDPGYYAFLAALLQKQGRNEEAAAYYREVVEQKSDNGIWWMGLGISLERIARTDQAQIAYQNSLSDRSLTPDIREFVSNRLSSINRQ